MSMTLYQLTLCSAVIWPLLLAIPAIHSRMPMAYYLAIFPAAVLTVMPMSGSLELPRLLLGTGLLVDSDRRWLLLMAVIIWTMVARNERHTEATNKINSCNPVYFLTFGANIGAILVTDVVGFFSFTTLMGYGFYALLIHSQNKDIIPAANVFLILMVIADLLLFEALIVAASLTNNFQYNNVQLTLFGSSSAVSYTLLVFCGFVLKTGLWPTQAWLVKSYAYGSLTSIMLLGALTATIGLLGMLRWLFPYQIGVTAIGIMILTAGIITLVYLSISFFRHTSSKFSPAHLMLILTGIFLIVLGYAHIYPQYWQQYAHLAYPFLALFALSLTALGLRLRYLQQLTDIPDTINLQSGRLYTGIVTSRQRFRLTINNSVLWLQSVVVKSSQLKNKQTQRINTYLESRNYLNDWGIRITLFAVFLLILALLSR